jgi:hypothetical protein
MTARWGIFYRVIIVLFWGAAALGSTDSRDIYSQSTAELFIQQARHVYGQDPLNPQAFEQAMTFLDAALALDPISVSAAEQILKLSADNCMGAARYSERIAWALERQAEVQADLYLLTGAVRCLLEQQNSRLDREVLLEQMLRKYGPRNKALASDLAAQSGLLAIEKADMQSAVNWLSYAYEQNPYNQLAFVKLQELSSMQDLSLKPEVYLTQLRLAIDLDPYSLNYILLYADTLKRMRSYEIASQVYEYAAQVYTYHYPDRPLDTSIFLSWALSCYHAPRQESKCIRVIEQYRDPERFDLMLEAVAGRAAMKLGQVERAKSVLEAAGKKAERLLSEKGLVQPVYPEQLAWYYSFVLERPEEALAWANQAYKAAPQREGVQEIFAYTLAQSGQMELAKTYAEPLQEDSQIASLVMALIAASQQDESTTLELLKSTVAMMPESFAAEKALELLKSRGSDYVTPTVVVSSEAALTAAYGNRVAPVFIAPNKRFAAKLLFNGSEFFYNNEFEPKLTIENNGSGPLVIGANSFLRGILRVDAAVSGDLNVEFPDLLSMQFRPSRPVLPGEYISVPLRLYTGKLRLLLETYPQANVDVAFTVYLDPVEDESGGMRNALSGTAPVRGQIHRSGIVLTRDFLIQRLDALAKGQQGQQLRAVRLFAGLLAEQKAFESSEALFKYVRIDRSLLSDSVRRGLRDENWKVRIQSLESLFSLRVPLDAGIIQDVSANLNHEQWPVRLMAMVLLTRSDGGSFQQVLDWIAQNDASPVTRRMALVLGGRQPEAK